jgi:hypothetical protein
LKEEALERNTWRNLFGRCYGPTKRQATKWMKYQQHDDDDDDYHHHQNDYAYCALSQLDVYVHTCTVTARCLCTHLHCHS